MINRKFFYFIIVLIVLLTGCASIPKASVDMSILLEQQLYDLKQANQSLINSVFDAKEQNVIAHIDNKLFLEYLDGLFKDSSIQNIWDKMAASKDHKERLEVIVWLNKNIQKKYKEIKDSLLVPLVEERKHFLKSFNDEFDAAIRMNSVITRNIASVNAIQDSYKNLASKLIDVNKLDSMVFDSLKVVDDKLNSIQKGLDIYNKNEDKINDILKKVK